MYARVEHPAQFSEAEAKPVATHVAEWLDQPVEIEISRHWVAAGGAVAALLAGLWLGGWMQVV